MEKSPQPLPDDKLRLGLSSARSNCLMLMDLQGWGRLFTEQQDLVHLLEVSSMLSAHSLVNC